MELSFQKKKINTLMKTLILIFPFPEEGEVKIVCVTDVAGRFRTGKVGNFHVIFYSAVQTNMK